VSLDQLGGIKPAAKAKAASANEEKNEPVMGD
jgi:hypothetical protein